MTADSQQISDITATPEWAEVAHHHALSVHVVQDGKQCFSQSAQGTGPRRARKVATVVSNVTPQVKDAHVVSYQELAVPLDEVIAQARYPRDGSKRLENSPLVPQVVANVCTIGVLSHVRTRLLYDDGTPGLDIDSAANHAPRAAYDASYRAIAVAQQTRRTSRRCRA